MSRYIAYPEELKQTHLTTKLEEKMRRFTVKLSRGSYWLVCSFGYISAIRNFAGGYEFAGRIIPESIPSWLYIPVESIIGLAVAYSPLTQIRNSLDKVWKVLEGIKKPRDLLSLSLPALFGIAAGLSFAQMGKSAFDTMISKDWGLGDNEMVERFSLVIFIFTFIAQSFMYAEKTYNLKLDIIRSSIRSRPILILPHLINAAGSIIATVTNEKFGAQAASTYLNISNVGSQTLGIISAIGPASMCFVDTYMASKFLHSQLYVYCKRKSLPVHDTDINSSKGSAEALLHTHQESEPSEGKTLLVSWKFFLFAFIMAAFSSLANLEYNIDVNFAGFDFLSMLFLVVGTFYNIVPKFIATIEREHRQSLKISDLKAITVLNGEAHSMHINSEDDLIEPLTNPLGENGIIRTESWWQRSWTS